MSADDWDAVMSVHLRGAFLMTRAAQAHMIEAKWGRIVNLSSTSALGNRGQVNYAAAKAGLQGFTKTLALELGKFGVTANAIAPGFIDTEMTQATADRLGVDFEDWKAAASREIPVGRVGTPDDIAAVAALPVQRGRRLRLRSGHLRRRRPEGLILRRLGSTVRSTGSGSQLSTEARIRPRSGSVLVERVQGGGVLLLHRLAPDLQARGDLAVLDGELAGQDLEPLDRLPALQLAVGLGDVPVDQVP